MSECRLSPYPDGRWQCEVCGRVYAMTCRANCEGKRPAASDVRAEDKAASCRACPHVRRETPFAISCLELDQGISCARERIGRHQKRLLDAAWRCERRRTAAPPHATAARSPADS